MSAWSDWKAGALTDGEYEWLSRREARREEYERERDEEGADDDK